MTPAHQSRNEDFEEQKASGFRDFMSNPLTSVVISTIPAGDNRDSLVQLLRAAFNTGFTSGQASIMLDLMKELLVKKDDPR